MYVLFNKCIKKFIKKSVLIGNPGFMRYLLMIAYVKSFALGKCDVLMPRQNVSQPKSLHLLGHDPDQKSSETSS